MDSERSLRDRAEALGLEKTEEVLRTLYFSPSPEHIADVACECFDELLTALEAAVESMHTWHRRYLTLQRTECNKSCETRVGIAQKCPVCDGSGTVEWSTAATHTGGGTCHGCGGRGWVTVVAGEA